MGILPLEHNDPSIRQLCVAPGITAHIDNVEEYIVAFSVLALCTKFEAICEKLAMPSAADDRLDVEAQLSLKFLNIAPVLSALALVDMGRLHSHTAINVIKVSRIKAQFKHADTVTHEILPTATLVTWTI
ncbi:hypothetical protein A1O1_05549 [Capronia coronata CBS 617.96]|uniref:Uncharacterized protein n=1 Tax=Capronia coronata CBS 617.96 TaxID=1182541 RepID=W9Z281_9EURO|nr:uncharacterized protein A1O1_05549 [Capronia coronata CBS 617.96]EXJ88619.1 hypothetical protein A1O1_05549 [Capronia coronata CBS 617.96]